MTFSLPRGSGVAIFAGDGAWRPRPTLDAAPVTDALVLSAPLRTLIATKPEEIRALLDEVEAEQKKGRFVAGYLAYEAGAAFGFTVRTPAFDALPLAWMAVYDPGSATLLAAAEWRRLLAQADVAEVAAALAGTTPGLSVSRDQYVEAIHRVREYIAAGDTYQANYTVRGRFALGGDAAVSGLAPGAPTGAAAGRTPARAAPLASATAPFPIDPLDYFLALVIRQPVPYAAYLDLGDAQVVSLSPEMFLRRDATRLESRPMKGTRPRGANHAEDVALGYELAQTEKERAENLMIVDMVRNDLGRVCRAGSVRVPTLYAIEPYRTVWQMVSTVTGDVNPKASLSDIMQAVFPGASITGAPKHHTMEIIAALETEPREVYTGTVGLFSPGGDFTCNIAIRTIIHRRGHCKLGTGSGIVWDAEPTAEYDETLVKATFATPPAVDDGASGRPGSAEPTALAPAAVPAATAEGAYLFETILLEAREGDATIEYPRSLAGLSPSLALSDDAVLARYRFLDEHLARMAASATIVGLPFDAEVARQNLVGLARITPDLVVVRLELDAEADFSVSARALPNQVNGAGDKTGGAVDRSAGPHPVTLLISPFRTDPDDPFLGHKTSCRGFYNREHRRALHEGCFDALFLNRLDRVTEGAITNLFARFGDRWVTPPLKDGLLPGIWRAEFRNNMGASEHSLTLAELLAADEIVVGNSVRGSVAVAMLVADPMVF
jgi:para-aminobenzoate synthetase/4-amino-4-deoxychorismate lyase